jgi:hypothetical protein
MTERQRPLMGIRTLYHSRLRRGDVEEDCEEAFVCAERVDVVIEERAPVPCEGSEERFECTLSVLRPAGVVLLYRSREFTRFWGLSSC